MTKDEGLKMKYFVLKPCGSDRYAEASRKAMRAYAGHIISVNKPLAEELLVWANNEVNAVREAQEND